MKHFTKYLPFFALPLWLAVSIGAAAQAPAQTAAPAQAAKPAPNPFEEGVYLYNQAYDTDLNGPAGSGTGAWSAYKSTAWLNIANLGVESDPGWGPGDWYDCSQHVNWSAPWGKQQQRAGAGLPDVVLGMGQMPSDPNGNDSWDQKLAWENATWKAEAANDPAIMGYFANYAKEVDDLGFKSVIIRLGYEFDGGWNPFGNLNVMSDMPGNYIKAWQNIVTTMRKADTKHVIRGFFWNPTDGNVQIDQFKYYPGDDYTDFVGFDEYDFGYSGIYKGDGVQPTQAQQDAAWKDMELPRINRFADLARAHNKKIIIGEWGLWQVNDKGHPSGGDNPSYIQRMHDWMADPANRVFMEIYFETPSDGDSQLWPHWGKTTTFPKSAALYRKLFGNPVKPFTPSAPAALTAKPGYGSATLAWQPSSGEPPPTYSVFRGKKAGGEAVMPLATGLTTPSFVSKDLTNGSAYYYTVKAANSAGTSAASPEAVAKPGPLADYAQNGGFESGDLSAWTVQEGSTAGAAYAENRGAGVAHAGSWQCAHWANSPYKVTMSQDVSLPNGAHTVSAWVKSSGGQSVCQMELDQMGGVKSIVPIPAAAVWTQISKTVTVTTGKLRVSFTSDAAANQWINLDDVTVQ